MKNLKTLKIISFALAIMLLISLTAYAQIDLSSRISSLPNLPAPILKTIPSGTIHTGVVKPEGETWGKAGSPHIVQGIFMVEGKNSPVLTIEAGAVVLFDSGASIEVGKNNPGGIIAKGAPGAEIRLSANAKAEWGGSWNGIRFFGNSLKNNSVLEYANIEYAGEKNRGAIYIESNRNSFEVLLRNVNIGNSLYAGLHMKGFGRLSIESSNVNISGTQKAGSEGGFPIVTDVKGSDYLPNGAYTGNAVNGVNITGDGSVDRSTVWRNIGIPYAITANVNVSGKSAPTLYLEPGVITLWQTGTGLTIGGKLPGYLEADAFTQPAWLRIERPEYGGEWGGEWINLSDAPSDALFVLRPEGGGDWFPWSRDGERLILSYMPDGTRRLFAVPLTGNENSGSNSKSWPANYYELRMNKQERSTIFESISKHNGKDISVPRPQNAADWLYIMKPDGSGDWIPSPARSESAIGMPDGSFKADGTTASAGIFSFIWVSKPDGSGDWLPIPGTASRGAWNARLNNSVKGSSQGKLRSGWEFKAMDGPKQLASWTLTNRFSILANGFSTANASSLEPTCALCGKNPAIIFGSLNIRWNSQQSQYSVRGAGASSIEEDPWVRMPASNTPNTIGSTRTIEAWNGQSAQYEDAQGENTARGTWKGLYFGNSSSSGSILRGIVVAFREGGDPSSVRMPVAGAGLEAGQIAAPFIPGGSVTSSAVSGAGTEASAAIHVEDNSEEMRRFLIADSLITQNLGTGIELCSGASFSERSTGNYIVGNQQPLSIDADALGSIPAGNYFNAYVPKELSPMFSLAASPLGSSIASKLATNEDLTNKNNWIDVTSAGNGGKVTHSATWRNLSIPYHFETGIVIGGPENPVVTIEAGTSLIFEMGKGIKVGIVDGAGDGEKGSLRAMGKGDSPVLFTSRTQQPGAWNGITFTEAAGEENHIGSITIEYAKEPLQFYGNFAPLLPADFTVNGRLKIE